MVLLTHAGGGQGDPHQQEGLALVCILVSWFRLIFIIGNIIFNVAVFVSALASVLLFSHITQRKSTGITIQFGNGTEEAPQRKQLELGDRSKGKYAWVDRVERTSFNISLRNLLSYLFISFNISLTDEFVQWLAELPPYTIRISETIADVSYANVMVVWKRILYMLDYCQGYIYNIKPYQAW